MFAYLYSFYLKYTIVYWMYNFHIRVHHMKSSKASSACMHVWLILFFSSSAACVSTWPCQCTNIGRKKEELLTLSIRERLLQRCSFDKKNESQRNVYSCLLSLIILTKYVVDEVLSNHLFGLSINYWIVILYKQKKIYKTDSCQFVYSYFIWYHTDKKIQRRNFSDVIILKFSWEVNFIINLFITLLVQDVVIVFFMLCSLLEIIYLILHFIDD
jgi:hypothetical protein